MKYPLAIFLIALSTLILASQAFCLVSSNIPIGDRVYRDIDTLAGYGLIQSNLGSTRPLSMTEVGRLLVEARRNWDAKTQSEKQKLSYLGDFLKETERLYAKEITQFKAGRTKAASFLEPVERASVTYAYLDGPFRIYNNEGIDYFDGHNILAETQTDLNLYNTFALFVQPLFQYSGNFDNIGGNDDSELTMHKAYAKIGLRNFDVEIGRDSLWWGPGYHGDLLMTTNAKPFDMVKLSNPHPTILPWVFKYLGLFQFNLILSKLGEDRPISEPYLYGLRLDFKPHPLIEVGLSQVAIFGGEGINFNTGDIFKILYSNENLTGNVDSNQEAGFDLSLRIPNVDRFLPLASSMKLYAEIGAEDTGLPPDKRAYLGGSRFYDFLTVKNLQATIEYVDTSTSGTPRVWYSHPYYPASYEGRIFGHHVGTDAKDLFFELSYDINQKIWSRVSFDHEQRGVSQQNPEESFEGRIEIEYYVTDWARINVGYGYEKISDLNYIEGLDQTNHLFGISTYFRF